MSRLRLAALLVALAAGCRCAAGSSTASGGAPGKGAVQAMPDPYTGLPPRGGVPPLERAAKVLENAGRALGYGSEAADSLRANAGEPWTRPLVLLLDHGGTEQLDAAWSALVGTTTDLPTVPMSLKRELRQAEARVLDAKAEQPPEAELRRRLLAEIAWAMVLLAPARADGGSPAPP